MQPKKKQKQVLNLAAIVSPPQHAVDDPSLWVPPHAPEWDHERITAEHDRLRSEAVAALGDPPDPEDADAVAGRVEAEAKVMSTAIDRHPVNVWMSGESCYSWAAPLTVPDVLRGESGESTAAIADYLTGKPYTFELRPLTALQWRSMAGRDPVARSIDRVRQGLVAVIDPTGKRVDPPRGDDGLITPEWIDALDRGSDRVLLDLISMAIFSLSKARGGEAEGKP